MAAGQFSIGAGEVVDAYRPAVQANTDVPGLDEGSFKEFSPPSLAGRTSELRLSISTLSIGVKRTEVDTVLKQGPAPVNHQELASDIATRSASEKKESPVELVWRPRPPQGSPARDPR